MGPAARQSGIAGGGFVASLTTAAERLAAGRARAVGVVATSFAPYVGSLGIDPDRIVHVPNWTREVTAGLPASAVRERFGWADDVQVVLHAGNIGLKQGLEQVVDAARLAMRRGDPVRFVLSGSGSQEDEIKGAAGDLANIEFLGLQPDDMHASLLAAADVLLLSERASQVDMSLPSKLTAYYAAGRPILAAVGITGSSAAEIDRSGAGIVVPAGRPAALLDALARLRTEPDLAARLAAAGPAHAAAHTSARACLDRGASLVDRIAA
jgi:glycosyltransferase involved in cell wall biosynthesis